MTPNQIEELLKTNNLQSCIPILEENHLMDEDSLRSMTNEDYISIGISIIGDRKKLLSLFPPKEEKKPEPEVKPEPKPSEPPVQNIVIEKKTHGVWVFIGVLIAIILIIGIIASL